MAYRLHKSAEKIQNKFFKTLVTKGDDGNHYVFVIPVKEKLDLKACARAVGVKSVAMLPQKELLKTTGYVHGGCSPIGMKKLFVTVYDETVVLLIRFLYQVARLGTQIEIAPEDIIKITEGKVAGLIQ